MSYLDSLISSIKSSQILRLCLLGVLTLVMPYTAEALAQSGGIWTPVSDSASQLRETERQIVPAAYRTFRLDKQALLGVLDAARTESARAEASDSSVISLPMPDGSLANFRFEHSLVVEKGLLDKYPELGRTYRAVGIDLLRTLPACRTRRRSIPSSRRLGWGSAAHVA